MDELITKYNERHFDRAIKDSCEHHSYYGGVLWNYGTCSPYGERNRNPPSVYWGISYIPIVCSILRSANCDIVSL